MPPTRSSTDDFDMAKLQKSLNQRKRHSLHPRSSVAKLSPAEIRSLNNNALASKAGSLSSSKDQSRSPNRRLTNATPPPENASAYQTQLTRAATVDLPTPPLSPSVERRRASQSSSHHGHIVHPKPRTSVQANFMPADSSTSRPSSAASSTYRGLPTYRGPEITRTGSLTMLQRPSPDIVSNPLSMFSRPRQSMVNSSPDRCKHDAQELNAYQAQTMLNQRSQSLSSIGTSFSRVPSPPRVTDSPVSADENLGDAEKSPSADDRPTADMAAMEFKEPEVSQQDESTAPAETAVPAGVTEPSKKEAKKRFSFFEKRDKERQSVLKKERRRTLPFTKNGSIDASPADGLESTAIEATEPEADEMGPHPAVRPLSALSLVIPSDVKGKGREPNSAPAYGRCACCGKLKRPSGYTSELSPVFENENIRTNFSFEMDRQSFTTAKSQSSSIIRAKYVPIIPMESENGIVQASIEPHISRPPSQGSEAAQRSITSSMDASFTTAKPIADPHTVTRFASLHGRRDSESVEENAFEAAPAERTPVQDVIDVLSIESEENTPTTAEGGKQPWEKTSIHEQRPWAVEDIAVPEPRSYTAVKPALAPRQASDPASDPAPVTNGHVVIPITNTSEKKTKPKKMKGPVRFLQSSKSKSPPLPQSSFETQPQRPTSVQDQNATPEMQPETQSQRSAQLQSQSYAQLPAQLQRRGSAQSSPLPQFASSPPSEPPSRPLPEPPAQYEVPQQHSPNTNPPSLASPASLGMPSNTTRPISQQAQAQVEPVNTARVVAPESPQQITHTKATLNGGIMKTKPKGAARFMYPSRPRSNQHTSTDTNPPAANGQPSSPENLPTSVQPEAELQAVAVAIPKLTPATAVITKRRSRFSQFPKGGEAAPIPAPSPSQPQTTPAAPSPANTATQRPVDPSALLSLPHLGPHFASSMTLRDLILAKENGDLTGKTSTKGNSVHTHAHVRGPNGSHVYTETRTRGEEDSSGGETTPTATGRSNWLDAMDSGTNAKLDTNLLDGMEADRAAEQERLKREKWVKEVMAV